MSSEDATIALKGMLGITNHEAKSAPLSASKKKNKKKKDGNSNNQMNNASARVNVSGNGKARSNENANASKKSGKKKKQKKKSDDAQKAQRKKKDETSEENSNFAWSAFQSPPDASNLPLPAFGSGSFDIGFDISSNALASDEKSEMNELTSSTGVLEHDTKELLNTPGAKGNRNRADHEIPGNPERGKKSTKADSSSTKIMEESASGVNLAALALNDTPPAKPALETSSVTEKKEQMDPLAMLMNPSYGASSNIGMHHQMRSPYQQPLSHNSYGMQSPMAPHVYAAPNHAMMAQPYIPHQVQAHSNYFPGRGMMVPTSPGYSVPVMVPPGVPMYGQYAMMPMGYGHHVAPNHMQQQQQQQQPQPQHNYEYSSPMAPKKESQKMSAPGSWAAKAAAKPTESSNNDG